MIVADTDSVKKLSKILMENDKIEKNNKGHNSMSKLRLPDNRIVTSDWLQTEDGQDELQLLRTTKERIVCLCKANNDAELFVKKYPSGFYGVARMPGTQDKHTHECQSGKDHAHATNKTKDEETYTEHEDGTFSIHTSFNIQKDQHEIALEQVDSQKRKGEGLSRNRASLFGMTNMLFDKAQLTTHFPWTTRNFSNAAYFLRRAMAQGSAHGVPLNEFMNIVSWKRNDEHVAEFWEWFNKLSAKGDEGRVGIIMGVINNANRNDGALEYRLRDMSMYIQTTKAAEKDLMTNYTDLVTKIDSFNRDEKRDHQIIGVFLVVKSKRKNNKGELKSCLLAKQAVLLMTTNDYVPVYNDAELRVANELASLNRKYVKNIVFDDTSIMAPDFRIIDEKPALFVELEKTTPEFKAKIDYYQRREKRYVVVGNEPLEIEKRYKN